MTARWPFETIAVVILPDHLHLIMRLPEGDANYPVRLGLLKQGFTKRLPERLKSPGRKGERNIWQRYKRDYGADWKPMGVTLQIGEHAQ